LETFYNALSNSDKGMLDATAGGAFTSKTYNEAYDILEKVANNSTEWSDPRERPIKSSPSASGAQDIDAIASLNAQIVALTNLVKNNLNIGERNQVNSVTNETCAFCGEDHNYENCPGNPISVNYVGNNPRNNPFSQTYNPGW
jgi:hypothetical protein